MNLKELKSIYSKYEVIIITGGFALVQVLFGRAVEAEFLKCPCEIKSCWYKALLAFILIAPCCVSSVIGLAINPNFWKLIIGCRSGNRSGTRPCCRPTNEIVSCPTWFSWDWSCRAWECCYYPGKRCVRMLMFVILFPIFWIVVITIDGDYWACVATVDPYDYSKNQNCPPVSF